MVVAYNKGKRKIQLKDKDLIPGQKILLTDEEAKFVEQRYGSEFVFVAQDEFGEVEKRKPGRPCKE